MANSLADTNAPIWMSNPFFATLINYLPFIAIPVIFYALVFRPQEKKKQQHEAFIKSVKKGEEIVTHSGLYGVVTDIDQHKNIVKVAITKGVEVKMEMGSIANILDRKVDERS